MAAKVGALPPTYQHDRSESGTAVNFPLPGGRRAIFPLKELPTLAKPLRAQRAATGKADPPSPLLRLRR